MSRKLIFVSLLTLIHMLGFSQKKKNLDWFDSIESKKSILSIYEEQLQILPFACKEIDIKTTYGNTHVIEAGDQSKPILVLVHGTNASAPAVLEAFSNLEKQYHIYAIDVIGQPNKSDPNRLKMKGNEYGKWMIEVLDALELNKVSLVGISFGGFLCMKAAAFDDSRIEKLILISTGGIAQGSLMKMYFGAFVPMKKYKKTGNEIYFDKFIQSSMTDTSTLVIQTMRQILLHYTIDTTPIPKISKKEANSITCPISVISSNQDIFFPGQKVIERANKIFPSFANSLLLKESLHVPSTSDTELIIKFIYSH